MTPALADVARKERVERAKGRQKPVRVFTMPMWPPVDDRKAPRGAAPLLPVMW